MTIAIVLKVISNLGQLSQDLKDIEQAAKDLFDGKLTKDEVAKLLSDVVSLLSSGIVSIPGVDSKAVVSTLQSGESVVQDVIDAVSDVREKGISAISPDLKKSLGDLISAVDQGLITKIGGFSVSQVKELLSEIQAGL